MNKLLLQIVEQVKGRNFRTGEKFAFDKLEVVVNGIHIKLKASGTAYEVVYGAVRDGQSIYLETKKGVYIDSETGAEKEYDAFYTLFNGDEVPLKVADPYGKTLVLRALNSPELAGVKGGK